MLIVGLTGGIASGKSTVSKRLEDHHNLTIVDADRIAREVVEPGKPAYKKIVSHFIKNIPDIVNNTDGSLNRPALGKYVFENKNELQALNSITHPAVRKQMVWEVIKSWVSFKKMVILDVPLLFEAKLDIFCGVSVCVVCDKDIQLERLMQRNPELSIEDCKNRINNQMSNEIKVSRSDIVIENNTTKEDLHQKVDAIVKDLMPSTIWSYFEVIIPPFGLVSALFFFVRNAFLKSNSNSIFTSPNLAKAD